MDSSRFDTWTRRQFGLTTGGVAAASLLGLIGLGDADAKKGKKKGKDKKEKKKCKKLGQACDQSVKKKRCCSKNQLCTHVHSLGGGTFCCKQNGDTCKNDTDCCGQDFCGSDGKCRLPN